MLIINKADEAKKPREVQRRYISIPIIFITGPRQPEYTSSTLLYSMFSLSHILWPVHIYSMQTTARRALFRTLHDRPVTRMLLRQASHVSLWLPQLGCSLWAGLFHYVVGVFIPILWAEGTISHITQLGVCPLDKVLGMDVDDPGTRNRNSWAWRNT